LIGGKAGADLCEGACPEQFMVQDLDATAGLAWSGSDTLNMDTLPAPGYSGSVSPRSFDPLIVARAGFTQYGRLKLKESPWQTEFDTSVTPTGSVSYTDNNSSAAPEPLEIRFVPSNQQGSGVPAVDDGTSLPGPACGGLDVNDKVTLTLAGGQTKEFTVKNGFTWRASTSNPSGEISEAFYVFEFWATDEGELYLKRIQLDTQLDGPDGWFQIKLGSTVVAEQRKESNVTTIELNVTGSGLSFEESCIAGYKL
jgi:hypothetical protein